MSEPAPTVVECDAVVIGAGPAGCASAAVLAEHGRQVVILEKARFPRYKIGESLIPYCWYPLNRLGMIERLERSDFVRKHSVQFVGMSGRRSQPFYFFEHTDHACARSWQVVRGQFDRMLLENAQQKGARALLGTRATTLVERNERVGGVRALDENGNRLEVRAPMTLDASGRDMFSVSRKSWRVSDPHLNRMALWTYYRGAQREAGLDEGATTVAYLPGKGWFWYIPLPDDTVSVGVVATHEYLYRDGRDAQQILDREIALQPWIQSHLASGTQREECRITSEYSYRSRFCAADGLVLLGDAFAFLDPVFSSGVFLALQSGVMAGDAVDRALTAGDCSSGHFVDYGRQLCQGIEAMRKLVYSFYDKTFSFGDLLKQRPDLRDDLTACLIGDLFRDFDPLFEAVGKFVDVPAPLTHGMPAPAARSADC